MAITFSQFKFHNQNGINADVTLEANGQVVVSKTVAPDGDLQVPLSVPNVSKLKLTVSADPGDHPRPDTQEIDLTRSATPYPLYVTSYSAQSGIGRIKGEVAVQFEP